MEWQHFKATEYKLIKQSLNKAVIFAGRNLYDPEQLKKYNITYYSIGREL